MNMTTWLEMIPLKTRQMLMNHEFLKRYEDEWTWELAIVEPTIIHSIYEQFSLHTRLVIHTLLEGRGAVITEEYVLVDDLKEKLNLSGVQCRLALQELAKLGICIVFQHPWQQRVWQIPFPIFTEWNRNALQQETRHWRKGQNNSGLQASLHYANPISLGRQLLYFLQRLQQADMTYTRKGILSKATTDTLQRHCLLDEATLNSLLGDKMIKTDYSAYISFMLELGNDLGIISSTAEGLTYNWHKLNQWLVLPEWQRERQLMQLVFEAHLCDAAQQSVIGPVSALLSLQQGAWYEAVSNQYEQLAPWLNICSQFGWIQWVSEGEAIYVHLQYFSFEVIEHLAVQDNGEIIVLPQVEFVKIWHLEHFAERILNQEVTIYRLSAKKLQAALADNYSIQVIRRLLSSNNSEVLPSFVDQLLDSVSKYSMHATPPQIPPYNDQQLLPLQPLTLARWGQWLSIPSVAYYQYELANLDLDIAFDLAELEQVTKSWYTEFRAYHPSTSKKMVEYAIEHEMSLELVIQGECKRYIPQNIIEETSCWGVEGVFELQENNNRSILSPDDWSAMKLYFH